VKIILHKRTTLPTLIFHYSPSELERLRYMHHISNLALNYIIKAGRYRNSQFPLRDRECFWGSWTKYQNKRLHQRYTICHRVNLVPNCPPPSRLVPKTNNAIVWDLYIVWLSLSVQI